MSAQNIISRQPLTASMKSLRENAEMYNYSRYFSAYHRETAAWETVDVN
jgi:hypothetical protein